MMMMMDNDDRQGDSFSHTGLYQYTSEQLVWYADTSFFTSDNSCHN